MMMDEHSHKWKACMLLVLGLVLVLVPLYTTWNVWVVLGVLLILKSVKMFVMPCHCCEDMGKMPRKR